MTTSQWKVLGKSSLSPIDNKKRKVVALPGRKSKDFIVTTRCRIMNIGGKVTMSAADLPGETGGSFAWKSNSTKIRLINADTANIVVEAFNAPSSARDAETITVTRTGSDGSTKVKTVKVTVAKVTFSAAATQLYGYDNFDTPNNSDDDHVCIKSKEHTFVRVTIEGGALGTDFDFICEDQSICKADLPAALASFDLRLNAGIKQKHATLLQVKVKCPSASVFAKLMVHVYTEKLVNVLVAKVYDSTSAGTALHFPTADYAAHTSVANEKLKEAVVQYDIVNHKSDKAVTDVRFDANKTGVLNFDINANGGGAGVLAIATALPDPLPGQIQVVIVRNMKSYYYLLTPAKIGDKTITVRGENVFSFTRPTFLGFGKSQEMVTINSSVGNVVTLAAPLTKNHAIGDGLKFPAAGWSSKPIIIVEGEATLDVAKWTVLHEVGHRALGLADINDATDFMNFEQSWTDYRLRYCPRIKHYTPSEVENQWETIPRFKY